MFLLTTNIVDLLYLNNLEMLQCFKNVNTFYFNGILRYETLGHNRPILGQNHHNDIDNIPITEQYSHYHDNVNNNN